MFTEKELKVIINNTLKTGKIPKDVVGYHDLQIIRINCPINSKILENMGFIIEYYDPFKLFIKRAIIKGTSTWGIQYSETINKSLFGSTYKACSTSSPLFHIKSLFDLHLFKSLINNRG
jgi:hypothetical protein